VSADIQADRQLGISLLEILVVIAILAIVAGFTLPNVGGWNCAREVRNDFDNLNGLMQTLRVEAMARNRPMLASIEQGGDKAIIRAWMRSKVVFGETACGQVGGSAWVRSDTGQMIQIKDVRFKRAALNDQGTIACFYPGGTAAMSRYTVTAQCDGKKTSYRTIIFPITGFLHREKYNTKTRKWDEL